MNSHWSGEWIIRPGKSRLDLELQYLWGIIGDQPAEVLDIGGSSFFTDFNQTHVNYQMIDLNKPLEKGAGGHNLHQHGLSYDGRTLPFRKRQFDVVIIGFVLHHAAQNSIPLLRQAKEISRRDILILEDLASPEYPHQWLRRNYIHQPGGVFRDDTEWRDIFSLLGLVLNSAYAIRRMDDPDERVYRAAYHLRTQS